VTQTVNTITILITQRCV